MIESIDIKSNNTILLICTNDQNGRKINAFFVIYVSVSAMGLIRVIWKCGNCSKLAFTKNKYDEYVLWGFSVTVYVYLGWGVMDLPAYGPNPSHLAGSKT